MLQIVVWGMAIMLVVKGLEVMHRQAIAQKANQGAILPMLLASTVAFLGALFLFWLANEQVSSSSTSNIPTLGSM